MFDQEHDYTFFISKVNSEIQIKSELIDCLSKFSCLNEPGNRTLVIAELHKRDIQVTASVQESAKTAIWRIVDSVLNFENGWQDFIKIIYPLEGGAKAIPNQKLVEFIEHVEKESPKQIATSNYSRKPVYKYTLATLAGLTGLRFDVPTLIEALEHNETAVRRDAAISLGKAKDVSTLEPLTRALKDNDKKVQANAVWALGELRDLRALPSLEELLHATNDNSVRRAVEDAIKKIKARNQNY
jgi:HEAT repeat protein